MRQLAVSNIINEPKQNSKEFVYLKAPPPSMSNPGKSRVEQGNHVPCLQNQLNAQTSTPVEKVLIKQWLIGGMADCLLMNGLLGEGQETNPCCVHTRTDLE